jgi:signal transduction histidine kinase
MKKYFWFTIGIVILGIIIFTAATGYLFSNGLQKLKTLSEQQMVAAATYCSEYIRHYNTISPDSASDDTVTAWLDHFCAGTGFERITVCDSSAQILWSSGGLLQKDEDFRNFLVIPELFDSAAASNSWYFTPSVKIDEVFFRSLYFGFYSNDLPRVLVIDADQNYFEDAEQFRNSVIIIASTLFFVAFALLISLFLIDRKAKKVHQRAAQNERLAFLGRTSAELAHELKNPLAIMKASVDVLRMEYDKEKKEKGFTFLSEEIMHLSELIAGILTFSKENKIVREPFHPHDVINEELRTFSLLYPTVTVINNLPPELSCIGDTSAFQQISSNLLRNAGDAMEGTGTITIRGEKRSKKYAIYFQDTGPGIDSSLVKQIFEPFVSGTSHGTGLGLAIARSRCELMGWSIECVSHAKGQTTFALITGEDLWVKF